MLQKAGHNHIIMRAPLRNCLLLLEEEIPPKLLQGVDDACENNRDRLARGCDRTALNGRGAFRP